MQEPLFEGDTAAMVVGGIIGALALVRKAWIQLSSDKVASTRNSAEIDLINGMRQEIDRVKKDLDATKQANTLALQKIEETRSREKISLEKQIHDLEMQIELLTNNYDNLKREVLDAYIMTSNIQCMSDVEEVKVKLLSIMDNNTE